MGITRPRLRFPSPALILAILALFAAVGGTTYAGTRTSASAIHFTKAALKNGWTKASGHSPAGYAKDSLGVVHLRGGISSGATSKTIFVLPKGLRPSHTFAVFAFTQLGNVGQLTINSSGGVQVAGSSASGVTLLDGISFVAGE
jgi:hypothetical protein